MVNLVGAVLALLGNVIVLAWAPLALIVLLIPFVQLLVFANHWVAGVLILVISGLLVWWARESYQATAWITGVAGGLLALLVFVAPAYFQLLVLLLELVILAAVIWIPGLVSVQARQIGIGIVAGELIFTSLLMAGAWGKAIAPLLIISVLLFVAATLLFERAARPHEKRRLQRRAAIWWYRTACAMVIFAFAPFWWPRVAGCIWWFSGDDPRRATNAISKVASSPVPIVGQPGTGQLARVPIDAGYYDLNGRFVTTRIWQEPGQARQVIGKASSKIGEVVAAVGGAIKKSPIGFAYHGWTGRVILKEEDDIRMGRESQERLEAHSHPSVVAKRHSAARQYYDRVAEQLKERVRGSGPP